MATKKFRNKLCVYCQTRPSISSGDHIFARTFFLKPHRANLPKAPACAMCGTEKSRDEHYLATVLPFGGVHPAAQLAMATVEDRLAKNLRLHRELSVGLQQPHVGPMTIPFNGEALERLFRKITIGLIWHHLGLYVPISHDVYAKVLTGTGELLFDHMMNHNADSRINSNLGEGTFVYEGAQGVGDPAFTIWRFHLFGGAEMAEADPAQRARWVGAISARKDFLERGPFE